MLIQGPKQTKVTAHFIRPTRKTGGPFGLPGPLRRWMSNCLSGKSEYAITACGQRDCPALLTQTGSHFYPDGCNTS